MWIPAVTKKLMNTLQNEIVTFDVILASYKQYMRTYGHTNAQTNRFHYGGRLSAYILSSGTQKVVREHAKKLTNTLQNEIVMFQVILASYKRYTQTYGHTNAQTNGFFKIWQELWESSCFGFSS
jgi:hypothetical protein